MPCPPTRSTAKSWIVLSSWACAERTGRTLHQERGASIGGQTFRAVPGRPWRPLFDAKKLGLEQRLDKRRAVDGHERPVPAAAQVVDLACDQFLADAAFAFEEDCEISPGHTLDGAAKLLHRRRGAN